MVCFSLSAPVKSHVFFFFVYLKPQEQRDCASRRRSRLVSDSSYCAVSGVRPQLFVAATLSNFSQSVTRLVRSQVIGVRQRADGTIRCSVFIVGVQYSLFIADGSAVGSSCGAD